MLEDPTVRDFLARFAAHLAARLVAYLAKQAVQYVRAKQRRK
ncbi:MAG: hypothetical protein ACU0D1_19590 [Pseudooceanicola nanhaiensis]